METSLSVIRGLNKAQKTTYFYNTEDDSVIVIGDLDISDLELKEIPVKLSVVTGTFDCSRNSLSSLTNCPTAIGKDFYCDNNQLVNLDTHPVAVGRRFSCKNNNLENDWLRSQFNESKKRKIKWNEIIASLSISSSEKLTDTSKKIGLFD